MPSKKQSSAEQTGCRPTQDSVKTVEQRFGHPAHANRTIIHSEPLDSPDEEHSDMEPPASNRIRGRHEHASACLPHCLKEQYVLYGVSVPCAQMHWQGF